MKEFETRGVWWLPDAEGNKVPGILRFTPKDGLALELIGALGSGLRLAEEPIPSILGFAEGLGKVTLEECLASGLKISFPGISCENYLPSIAYTGAHFGTQDSAKFVRARVQFQYLADWLQQSGLQLHIARDYQTQAPIRVTYEYPSEISASTEYGTIEISFGVGTKGDLLRELTLRQTVAFVIRPNTPMLIDELYKNLMAPLQSFLTLGTERANSITSITAYSPEVLTTLSNGKQRQSPIGIYLRARTEAEPTEKRLFPQEMLFGYPDISDHFEESISSWISASGELRNTIALYTNSRFTPKMHADQLFLAMVQAAESYHRRRFRSTRLPKKEFRKRKREVLRACPAGYKSWLEQALQWQNEPTLKQRLEELVEVAGECVQPLVGDMDGFIRKTVATRNYYTHYVPYLRRKAASGEELYLLGQAMSVLVRLCLLNEIGISSSKRKQLFLRNSDFCSLLSQAPVSLQRVFFPVRTPAERNDMIPRAYADFGFTQSSIAKHVGLHPSTVSRIISKAGRKSSQR